LARIEQDFPESGGKGCLKVGCLVLVALVGIGSLVVIRYGRSIGAAWTRHTLVKAIDRSHLPAEEKPGVIAHVDAVTARFKTGQVSLADLGMVIGRVSRGPFFPMVDVLLLDRNYVQLSGLSEAERAEASQQVHRLARGLIDGAAPIEVVVKVQEPIVVLPEQPGAQPYLKRRLTRSELEEVLRRVKAAADEAGVADRVEPVVIADEFGKQLEKGLRDAYGAARVPANPEPTADDTRDAGPTGGSPDDAEAQ